MLYLLLLAYWLWIRQSLFGGQLLSYISLQAVHINRTVVFVPVVPLVVRGMSVFLLL